MEHSIGKTIAELRRAKGWTQVELAEKLDVSDKTVSKWENTGGFPEITQLPVLAALFDVSIDFLMTGKSVAPQIIAMSRAEMCAKNDDVTMLSTIDPSKKDEDGKTLSDYVYRYESVRVFNACEKIELKPLEEMKMALIANNVERLSAIKKSIHMREMESLLSRLTATAADEIFEAMVSDDRISEEIFDCLLQPVGNSVWYEGFPYLITACCKKGLTAKLEKLLAAAEANNQYASDRFPRGIYGARNRVELDGRHFGIVVVPKEAFEFALANSDMIDMAERFNRINSQNFPISAKRYIASRDEIRIAKLKLDKSVSAEELAIQSCIHDGVLCVDELLATKNLAWITDALSKYPIHFAEALVSWYLEENWQAMLAYAMENNDREGRYTSLIAHITNLNEEAIEEDILKAWYNQECSRCINAEHLYYYEENEKKNLIYREREYDRFLGLRGVHVEEAEDIITLIYYCKKRIVDDLTFQFNKESTISKLTKDFFYSELKKGNTDIVIIKLCVRLESVLKNDYRYEGDFSEMLEKYCDEELCWEEYDDDREVWSDNSDEKTIRLLHNLRIERDNIVHPEKIAVDFTVEDLRYCIEYICGVG